MQALTKLYNPRNRRQLESLYVHDKKELILIWISSFNVLLFVGNMEQVPCYDCKGNDGNERTEECFFWEGHAGCDRQGDDNPH